MALTTRSTTDITKYLKPSQTAQASKALLRKVQADQQTKATATAKPSLLADAEDEAEDDIPIWLVLTTKKHIIDQKRLKPSKILLPHPYVDTSREDLRICLITADPQRKYKDLIAHPSFPVNISQRIGRVIGLTKLKAKYKSFESRRQLLGEYDVFLADDRVITYLPQILGKPFYKTGTKRPIPVTLQGRRQNFDENGTKRRKLSEGGTKVTKAEIKPTDVAKEIERALSSALVHLAPSTTTSVKVGTSLLQPKQLQENVEAVTAALVERHVPQKWSNVRAVHIKGPETVALPLYLTDELWENENDVLEEAPPVKQGRKRKASALSSGTEVIEVPGPDGNMRRLEAKTSEVVANVGKKRKAEVDVEEGKVEAKAAERAERAERKAALEKQKNAAKASFAAAAKEDEKVVKVRSTKRVRTKAADLI